MRSFRLQKAISKGGVACKCYVAASMSDMETIAKVCVFTSPQSWSMSVIPLHGRVDRELSNDSSGSYCSATMAKSQGFSLSACPTRSEVSVSRFDPLPYGYGNDCSSPEKFR